MSSAISDADLAFCVAVVNQLLAQCGISHTITSISQCSPSLFVLLFEGLFHFRLPNIHREKKQTSAEKLHNIQELVSTMEWTVGFSLRHIDAQRILDGEPKHLCLLIQIFKELCHIQATQQRRDLQLRRPQTPLPVNHEPEYYEENGESQTDEVSQWCDTVLRESHLKDHIQEVVALNPDYCMSTSSTPHIASPPVQLLSLAARQQRQTSQQMGELGEHHEGESAEEDQRQTEAHNLLHPRPQTAMPLCPLPGTIAALRQPHLSPHAFLPMPKTHGDGAPLEEQGTIDAEQLFDYPPMREGSFHMPTSAAAALRSGSLMLLPPELQYALQSLTMSQLEALLQDSQRPPPPSDQPPSLDEQIPQPSEAPPSPRPPPPSQRPTTAQPVAVGPLANGSVSTAPEESPPSAVPPSPRQLPPDGKQRRPEGKAKRRRQGSPAISQRPSGPPPARLPEKVAPSASATSTEAMKLRIMGDEKRDMLRARRALQSHQQQIHAAVCSRKETEQAALLKLFRLLLKRERMRVSEERGQLRRQQREADQERATQQEALETYFVTQHQMLTEEFRRVAECRRQQEKHHKQALEKLRREARDRQLTSLEEYYQKLRSQEDAKFYRSSLESVMRAFACSAG